MKKGLALFCALVIILITSVAIADGVDSEIWADTMIEMLKEKDIDVVDLQRIRDALDVLIQKKQSENAIDPEYLGIWQEKYFVDSFGDKTDHKYISATLDGAFSNSATTNSSLKVLMLVSLSSKGTPKVEFEFYEYDNNKVKYSDCKYFFTIKDENSEMYHFTYFMGSSEQRMYMHYDTLKEMINEIWTKDAELIEILKNNNSLKFSVEDDKKYSKSTYRFDIGDTTGFINAYNWLVDDSKK